MERNDEVDVAPGLLKILQDDFNQRIEGNKKLAEIYEKVNSGTATYIEANEFALNVGNTLADVFRDNISADILPDGRMYYNIADRVIRPMMVADHALISSTCLQVQTRLDQIAQIGIKAQKAELNDDKVKGIINKVSEAEHYEDVAWVLDEPIKTFSQSIVDDSIKANVDFQGKAGLHPKIERISAAGCCEWCNDIAGTYRYPDVPKDVYRRHAHCRCTVDYDPADGKGYRQNVHEKNWQSEGEYREKVEKMRYAGLEELRQHKKGDKVEITDQAIQKVKAIGPTGSTKEHLSQLQEMNRQILTEAKEKNDSNEVAMLLCEGKISAPIFGKAEEVKITADPEAFHLLVSSETPLRSITVSHNHPGLSYFSMSDIGTFLQFPTIGTMEIVTNQGKTWYISKRDGFDDEEMLKTYKNMLSELENEKRTMEEMVDIFLKNTYTSIERNR